MSTQMGLDLWFLGAALAVAVLGASWDAATGRIPNAITYTGILVGIALHSVFVGWRGLGSAVLGMLVGGGIFLAFYVVRAMGAGDVKLMAAVGSLAGASKILEIALAGAIGGGFLAVGYMIYHRKVGVTLRNVIDLLQFHRMHGAESHPEINLSNPAALRMPYGIAIAAGVLYSFCMIFAGR
jgi:prepilin peptidase CpaA